MELSGPLFNGAADRAAADLCDTAEQEVAGEGERLVRARLGQVLKRPNGFYESRISDEPDGSGWKVTDNAVIYGHWLEGTGSRNAPKTRFKGYATFRIVTQTLTGRAADIAERVSRPFLARMGGKS